MATEAAELAKRPSAELAEPNLTREDVRHAVDLWGELAAQDRELVLESLRDGTLPECKESIRIMRTHETDSESGGRVFRSVGSSDTPDGVLSEMVSKTFAVTHRQVASPAREEPAALPGGGLRALPPPEPSHSSQKEENHER